MAADKLFSKAKTKRYTPGTVLFEENDPGTRMYVIRRGRVRIYRRIGEAEIVLAVLGPGDFFGEMALLEKLPRSASAQIVDEATLIEVDSKVFAQMVTSNGEIAIRIMRKLAARVRELDVRLQNLLLDSGVGRAIEVLRWLLPKGAAERGFVRLKGAIAHVNIAAQAGIPPNEVEGVLLRLRQAGCLKEEGGDVLVAASEVLDDFSTYLDLKRKYDPPVHHVPLEAAGRRKQEVKNSMQRLLKALEISPPESEANRTALSSQYQRYVELRARFEPA